MTDDVRVNRSLTIPGDEIKFRFTPSGGPGGQHANRSSTRVELTWNVGSSPSLGPRQREKLRTRLARRIDSSGTLRLSSDAHRSQTRNRDEVLKRLATLVADALRPTRARVATQPTTAARERRLRTKKKRSETKKLRKVPSED
ncbi:MAG: aminoacyl-tRNA hydrolase [Actinomycetota bacterium]|nr:aminoacyl-tRNA hydrolase [Actinomycetota bacterium]